MSFFSALRLFLSLLLTSVSAQGTSIILPTTAAPSGTALATAKGYTYVGCWNETVGVPNSNGARALSGGMSVCSLQPHHPERDLVNMTDLCGHKS